MSSHTPPVSPINPLPPVVVALVLVMGVIELAFSAGSAGLVGGPTAIGWRLEYVQRFAFSGDILDWMLAQGVYPAEHLVRFVSYPFVNPSFTSALFGIAMLAALGKFVGEVLAGWAVLAVFFLASAVAAVVYALITDSAVPLVGPFPGVYGLIGAFTYLMWLRLKSLGERQAQAFSLIGFLMGIQLVFGLLFGGTPIWIAEMEGFLAGFALCILVMPGGFARLRDRLRQR